jgi:hypothetical protein
MVTSAVLVGANLVYFAFSLGSYLDAHQQTVHRVGYLIDIQTAQDHVLVAVWWQVVANGALLLPFRDSRRIGVALLVGAGVTFLLYFWVLLSFAGEMG